MDIYNSNLNNYGNDKVDLSGGNFKVVYKNSGWSYENGIWYYFYESGSMATNTIIDGWKIDGNGVATPILNDNNNNDNSLSQNQGTVYITPNGKSYHSTKNCTALKRSTTILSVSLQEAINQGKSDACNLYVH